MKTKNKPSTKLLVEPSKASEVGIVIVAFAMVAGGLLWLSGGNWSLSSQASAAKPPKGGGGGVTFCPDVYAPVCGTNGKTYSNDCYAKKANATIACNGECPCGTGNPDVSDPTLTEIMGN